MNQTPLGPRPLADPPDRDDATIRRVLHVVGPRPEVPADALAAARDAARAEWRRTVNAQARRRRYRHPAVWLAAATLLLAAGLVYRSGFMPPRQVGTFAVVADALHVEPRDATGPVVPGESVRAGARIDTGDGRGALVLASGVSLRLDTGTELRLRSASVLELVRGAVYVDSAGATSVEVRTSFGVVRDVGTQFEVRRLDGGDAALRVRVREGAVTLARGGETHEGRAGTELQVTADGTVTRGDVAAHGEAWGWILATAPPFEAEGRTLDEFLGWLRREGGWTLRYADDELAVHAAGVTLSGDTVGLTPLEAAQLWLPASGLVYRLEDGILVVDTREGETP